MKEQKRKPGRPLTGTEPVKKNGGDTMKTELAINMKLDELKMLKAEHSEFISEAMHPDNVTYHAEQVRRLIAEINMLEWVLSR
jgi:hypothetical protein